MKPKDLKSPYTFKERRPLIENGIFYLPDHYASYDSFAFPSWEELFGNAHPVALEYCSGNGEWIIERARQSPEQNWVAVEKKFERVRKIHSKRANQGLSNLFIICGDAKVFSRKYLKEGSLSAAFVNFPDPWPKARHAKHRIIQPLFVADVQRGMHPEGSFTLVSDAKAYIDEMKEVMGQSALWQEEEPPKMETYGSSYFERLWKEKGRTIYFLRYGCTK